MNDNIPLLYINSTDAEVIRASVELVKSYVDCPAYHCENYDDVVANLQKALIDHNELSRELIEMQSELIKRISKINILTSNSLLGITNALNTMKVEKSISCTNTITTDEDCQLLLSKFTDLRKVGNKVIMGNFEMKFLKTKNMFVFPLDYLYSIDLRSISKYMGVSSDKLSITINKTTLPLILQLISK